MYEQIHNNPKATTYDNYPIPTYIAPADPTNAKNLPYISYAANGALFNTTGPNLEKDFGRRGTTTLVMLMERYAVSTTPTADAGAHYYRQQVATGHAISKNYTTGTAPNVVIRTTPWTIDGTTQTFQVHPPKNSVNEQLAQGMTSAGIQVAMCDASVRTVTLGVLNGTGQWQNACNPNGSPLKADWYQ
jgi:hypothetical protein